MLRVRFGVGVTFAILFMLVAMAFVRGDELSRH